MPSDDLEKFRQFMIEQQAQFWADLRAIEARHAETAKLADENRQRIGQLVDVCLSLSNYVQAMDERLLRLADAQRELAESQAHTDRRLDAVVDISRETDRLLRELGQETDRRIRELGQETDRRIRELGQETDRRIRELAESQAHRDQETDRRIRELAEIVNKLAKRNGSGP